VKLFGLRIMTEAKFLSAIQDAVANERYASDSNKAQWLRQEGYVTWIGNYPPSGLIEICRPNWTSSEIIRRDQLAPEANVNGLFWRLPRRA